MHFEILLEEESAEEALIVLLPRIIKPDDTYRLHPFQGKKDLLRKLRSRLSGYARAVREDQRVVVLVDRDSDDCFQLKARLEQDAAWCGLSTKKAPSPSGSYTVITRIAVEELEAWFFGDWEAARAAYPQLSPRTTNKAAYRNPDGVQGGTWEALERELQKAGYYRAGMPKREVARNIAKHMNPLCNRSKSFQVFMAAFS